jgi:hypothetical protein
MRAPAPARGTGEFAPPSSMGELTSGKDGMKVVECCGWGTVRSDSSGCC